MNIERSTGAFHNEYLLVMVSEQHKCTSAIAIANANNTAVARDLMDSMVSVSNEEEDEHG